MATPYQRKPASHSSLLNSHPHDHDNNLLLYREDNDTDDPCCNSSVSTRVSLKQGLVVVDDEKSSDRDGKDDYFKSIARRYHGILKKKKKNPAVKWNNILCVSWSDPSSKAGLLLLVLAAGLLIGLLASLPERQFHRTLMEEHALLEKQYKSVKDNLEVLQFGLQVKQKIEEKWKVTENNSTSQQTKRIKAPRETKVDVAQPEPEKAKTAKVNKAQNTISETVNKTRNPHNLWEFDGDDSCARFMGNGFEEIIPICEAHDEDIVIYTGEITCKRNPTTGATMCEGQNIIIDPTLIDVAQGGEPIHEVEGRKDEEEIPIYTPGAFQVPDCRKTNTSPSSLLPFHLKDMMEAVVPIKSNETRCQSYEERHTLIITRYEYANLYHQYTDWYNAYQAAMIVLNGDKDAVEQVNIIFFDGHAQGALDDMWKILFPRATISFVSELNQNVDDQTNSYIFDTILPTCLRHAIFVSPGYYSPLSELSQIHNGKPVPPRRLLNTCQNSAWHQAFRDTLITNARVAKGMDTTMDKAEHRYQHYLRGVHQFPILTGEDQASHRSKLNLQVLFISRQDYQPHPRSPGRVTRRIANEEDLLSVMQSYSYNSPDSYGYDGYKAEVVTNVTKVVSEELDVASQILLMEMADVIVGMHGAGLSHITLARPGKLLIEVKPPRYHSMSHFPSLAALAGCLYKSYLLRRPANAQMEDQFAPYVVPFDDFKATLDQSIETYLNRLEKTELEEASTKNM